jgi:hypothetical protein
MRHLSWHHLRVAKRKRWVAAAPPVALVSAVLLSLGGTHQAVGGGVAGTSVTNNIATPGPTPQPTLTPWASVSASPAAGTSTPSPDATLGIATTSPTPAATKRSPGARLRLPVPVVHVGGGSSTVGQIAFGNGQDAYLGHTAGSRYVEINDYEYGRVGAIRAADSTTKVLVYQEAQTEGPGSCQYDAHPSWGISYCYADANHPEWFLLTNSGQRAQYTDNGYYMMDIGSVTYQQAFAANVIATARRDGFDGVELDDVNLSPAHGTDGTLAKYTDAQYAAATVSFVAAVSRDISAAGLVISANVGNSNPWDSTALAESQQIAANLSVYNHEFWLRWQEGTPLMTGAEWLASIHMEEVIQASGAAFTALTYGSLNDVQAMRYVRGSFLLGWNGQSGSALIYRPDPEVVDSYSPEWTIDVGTPTGDRYAVGAGWRRQFTGGTVVVNPSGGSQTFDLGGAYRMPDGSLVSSVTLGPASALVLRG